MGTNVFGEMWVLLKRLILGACLYDPGLGDARCQGPEI